MRSAPVLLLALSVLLTQAIEYPNNPECGFRDQTYRAVGDMFMDIGAGSNWEPAENRGVMQATNRVPCEWSVVIRGLRPGKKYYWKVTIGGAWANNWGCSGNNNPPACETQADPTGGLTFTIIAKGNPFVLSTSAASSGGGGGGNRNGKYGPIVMNMDNPGGDLQATTASNPEDCQAKCFQNKDCGSWGFDTCGNGCWLKRGSPGTSANKCRATGQITANRGNGGGGGGGGGATNKLGLCWGDWDNSDMAQLAGGGKRPTWFYTWSAWSIKQNTQGLEWVPMLHLPSQMNEWHQAKNTANYYANSPNFLFINEPDMNGVSPQQAADIWRQEFQPFKGQGKRLGGPCVASNDVGTNWMQDFINRCGGCSIDFIPLHWYGARAQDFINYVTMMHNKFGKNIWVTEWGCATWGGGSCNDNDIKNLMSTTSAWMDQQPWIERYAWFAAMSTGSIPNDAALARNNALLGPGGKSRTFMGDQYIKGGH